MASSAMGWVVLAYHKWGVQLGWMTIAAIATVLYLVLGWWLGWQYDRVRHSSERDVLTNLYNRRFIFEIFPRIMKRVELEDQPLSVLIVDADNLKVINDVFGHLVGDVAIRHVADVLLRNTRKTDVVARIGGDEFFIIAPLTDKESSLKIVERIERELRIVSESLPYTVSASIGVATYPTDARTLDGLFGVADSNMYQKKQQKPQSVVKSS
ncbi:MAG: GGDEF domain-containing protein [Tumebacillaceae bacterium]